MEGDAHADGAGRGEDAVVDLLRPPAHLGAAGRIVRLQRMLRETIVDVFIDDDGFGHDDVVVDERRHHTLRIELQIFRLLLIAGAQIHMPCLIGQALFGEAEPHLLRADRHVIVIKHKHRRISYCTIALTFGQASLPYLPIISPRPGGTYLSSAGAKVGRAFTRCHQSARCERFSVQSPESCSMSRRLMYGMTPTSASEKRSPASQGVCASCVSISPRKRS